MRKLIILPITLFFLLCQIQLAARHIVGGELSYVNLGNDLYEFTMRMYRDCNCVDCAPFDPQAEIGVYRCGTDVNCAVLNQSLTFATASARRGDISIVDAPDYPCLVPPDVCVEQTFYVWQMTLPKSTESYFVAYQRCCRNVTINNIIAPQATGSTYVVEITPRAQELENSSPSFNDFPPIVICAGSSLDFSHSATDPDGDQLVYEFCAPLDGGDNNVDQALLATCQGAAPSPACPPPYNTVSFRAPEYTPFTPLGPGSIQNEDVVRIDSRRGTITGTPQFFGTVCGRSLRFGISKWRTIE